MENGGTIAMTPSSEGDADQPRFCRRHRPRPCPSPPIAPGRKPAKDPRARVQSSRMGGEYSLGRRATVGGITNGLNAPAAVRARRIAERRRGGGHRRRLRRRTVPDPAPFPPPPRRAQLTTPSSKPWTLPQRPCYGPLPPQPLPPGAVPLSMRSGLVFSAPVAAVTRASPQQRLIRRKRHHRCRRLRRMPI